MKIVGFDIESTSLDFKNGRIVEICLIKINKDGSREKIHELINPECEIPKEASDIHGITNEMVKDKPTFKQVAEKIYDFINGFDIITYNGNSFDTPFLYCEFNRAGIEWDYTKSKLFDACSIFKRQESRTLAAASKFYLGKELVGAHGAEADTEATIEIFFAQKKRYEDLPTDDKELALYCNNGKELTDLGGCFSVDSNKEYVFNFGKHKGELAKFHKPYLEWMLTSDFMPDAKNIINKLLCKTIKMDLK